MGLIGGVLLAAFVAVASRLITDDVKERLPWIRHRLIERAVRRLPDSERERYEEEWRSHVNDTPGELSKIGVALGYSFAAYSIADIIRSGASEKIEELGRRAIEITLGLASIVFYGPWLLFLALLIKLDSRGPVVVSYLRIGQNGKPFRVYKLRTLHIDGPGVTRVAGVVRLLGLDSFPQVMNLIRGEMSLVGPRPRRIGEAGLCVDMKVKPGLMWVSPVGCPRGSEEMYEDHYMKNRSLWLDLRFMFWVAARSFMGRGRL